MSGWNASTRRCPTPATREHGLLLVRWAELCEYRGDAQRMTSLLAAARSVADTIDSDEIRAHAAALELLHLGFGNPRAALAAAPEVEALCRGANNRHDADSMIWARASWAAATGDRRYGEAEFARAEVEIVEECPRCAALRRSVWAGFDLSCGRPESAAARATAGRAINEQLADPPTEALALAVNRERWRGHGEAGSSDRARGMGGVVQGDRARRSHVTSSSQFRASRFLPDSPATRPSSSECSR